MRRRLLLAVLLLGLAPGAARGQAACPRFDADGFLHCHCDASGVDPAPWVVGPEVEDPVQIHLNWIHGKLLQYNQKRFAALATISDWAQLAPISDASVDRMQIVLEQVYMEGLDNIAPGLDTLASIGQELTQAVERSRLATSARTLQGWIVDQRARYAAELDAVDLGHHRAVESCRAAEADDLEAHFAALNATRRRLDAQGPQRRDLTDLELRMLSEYLRLEGEFRIFYLRDDDEQLLTGTLPGSQGYGFREASVALGSKDLNRAVNNAIDNLKGRVGAASIPDLVRQHLRAPLRVCFFAERHNRHAWERKLELYCTLYDADGALLHEAQDATAALKAGKYDEWQGEIQQTAVWN